MLLRATIWLLLAIIFASCSKNNGAITPTQSTGDTTNKTFYTWDKFAMGADLSYVNEVQDFGGTYKDSGTVQDPYLIFKKYGCNTVRVRLWYDPEWLKPLTGGKMYSGLADAEKTIQRAKAHGMAVNLDIHYSDTWADAGDQNTPAAWADLNLSELTDSVYQYTLRVLNELKSKNLTPEMVQIGNETNEGMLYPQGQVVNNNWVPFGQLLNSGIKAVRDFSTTSTIKPLIILHVAKLEDADWWINNIINNAQVTDFDVLGVSEYYFWSTVSSMAQVSSLISSLKTNYKKAVMIVETACPWTNQNADSYANQVDGNTPFTGYTISQAQQLQYMKDFTQAVISGGGAGVMYWEPAWITSSLKDKWGTGSSWDNCTLFDFAGNTLPAMGYMGYKYQF